MNSHDTAPPLAGSDLPADLVALSSLAVAVLIEHTNDADLRAVCGAAWPCELVVLVEHNYDVAAL